MKIPGFLQKYIHSDEMTIYGKILHGYSLITYMNIFIVAFSIVLLLLVRYSYGSAMEYERQQSRIQSIISAHYQWLNALDMSIHTGRPFTGSLDPETCTLGVWLSGEAPYEAGDEQIDKALKDAVEVHGQLHALAAQAAERSKTDREAALKEYAEGITPKVEEIAQNLNIVSARFHEIAENKPFYTNLFVFASLFVYIGLVVYVRSHGPRIAKAIADPVVGVANWAQALTEGISGYGVNAASLGDIEPTEEILTMMQSLTILAEDIRNHAEVIAQIAKGDLTHYVEIKSNDDVLGKSLYHLVQNNDLMFSQLLKIADVVATSANSIASANQSLAQSAAEQAEAVDQLSETVKNANQLALENNAKAGYAKDYTDEIKEDIRQDLDKMKLMVQATEDIRAASLKISDVMQTIDDIAYRTNLLAINASIEAAHAGDAGKGFGIVANEIRDLATKSAEAAENTRVLVEDTLEKTLVGARISKDASETFSKVVKSADQIADVVLQIAGASGAQQRDIAHIHEEIRKISDVVAGNAAISEQTAAATKEMNDSADVIKESMQKFNLRNREEGKAYIPPEKQDDEQFIQEAQKNYQKAVKNAPPRLI